MEMAKLSIEGELPPEALKFPKMSSNYGEFVKEYPVVASGLSGCSLEHCLAIIGSMLTLPEFQSNAYRLGVLIHLAFLCAKRKARPSQAQIVAWFNQLDKGTCGRQEDAAEDVFVSIASAKAGDFRLFEGNAEGNGFHTQLFLTILDDVPDNGSYQALKAAVGSLLRLSDELAERTGIPVYSIGNTTPVSNIRKPDNRIWSELRKRASFTFEELARLGIDPNALRPFTISTHEVENLEAYCPGHSPLDFKPIFPTKNGLIVYQPGLIGTAIRCFLITSCIKAGMEESLHAALANAYTMHFANESFLGSSAPLIEMQRYDSFYASQVVKEIDPGRYLHLLFFADGFEGFDNGGFIGLNPVEKISDFVNKSVDHAYQTYSAKDGFREGVTFAIGCGWGRSLGLGLGENPSGWRTEMIPAHDATTLSRTPSFQALDLLRVLDASDALGRLNIEVINANGFLNLFAWIKGNNGHIIPHEKMDDDLLNESGQGFFNIPLNCNLRLRHTAYLSVDVRTLARPDGSIAKLRRAHGTPRYGTEDLSPFYADIAALEERIFRSVYIGNHGTYWVEANTPPELDIETRIHLGNMTMHWGELVFQHFDQLERTQEGVRASCCFHFQDSRLPDGNDPIPSDEDVSVLVECRSDDAGASVTFDVKEGFISAGRRPDNLGERAIVRALVRSCFTALSETPDEGELDATVNEVVKTDNARHFHAFSVPQLRDYVRSDLPDRVQIIEKMDDAYTRLGLGWLCRNPSEGSQIEGIDECKAYLRKLVNELVQNFKTSVAQFDKRMLVEKLLRNHEALFAEMDTWKRTYGAVEALSSDKSLATREAIKQIGNFNAASMSSRIAIEAAICESPLNGGLKPGNYDIAQMLAYASLIHHMGGYSEAMIAGMMPPEIKISPAGEVMMNHEFSEEVIQPFGEHFQSNSLRNSSQKYIENYASGADGDVEEKAEQTPSDHDRQFEEAWLEEYGFTLDTLQAFVGGIDALLVTDRKAVLQMKLSDLIKRLCSASSLSSEIVEACIQTFSFIPREKWDVSPEGYMSSAWFPWQFQRQLSLVSRPIIQLENSDDPECLIAPAMIIMNVAKFVSDARDGALDQRMFKQDGLLFKCVGKVRGDQGEAFNEKVAEKLRSSGWDAQANLSDGQILNRKKNPAFGDVDVLAWSNTQKRVLVVECKDLSFDKTIGEIARRLANYQGVLKENGKRDDLKKHLDRCEDIESNIAQLSRFVGFDVERIQRVLLFSQSTPIQFSKIAEQYDVTVCTFADIEDQFQPK